MLKKLTLFLILAALCVISIGCQTVSGLGRDITWTSEATADLLDGN